MRYNPFHIHLVFLKSLKMWTKFIQKFNLVYCISYEYCMRTSVTHICTSVSVHTYLLLKSTPFSNFSAYFIMVTETVFYIQSQTSYVHILICNRFDFNSYNLHFQIMNVCFSMKFLQSRVKEMDPGVYSNHDCRLQRAEVDVNWRKWRSNVQVQVLNISKFYIKRFKCIVSKYFFVALKSLFQNEQCQVCILLNMFNPSVITCQPLN